MLNYKSKVHLRTQNLRLFFLAERVKFVMIKQYKALFFLRKIYYFRLFLRTNLSVSPRNSSGVWVRLVFYQILVIQAQTLNRLKNLATTCIYSPSRLFTYWPISQFAYSSMNPLFVFWPIWLFALYSDTIYN